MVRLACVGGFLGAGKTTAILAAARTLNSRGLRVGIITNDQGSHLVDTALVREAGFHADEITGGCFCCRFKEFLDHALKMVAVYRPDFLFAEAVGSCTDLAATIYHPLQKYHAGRFELAPLSILAEPDRLAALSHFDEGIGYLFQKQLAEADLVLLNKCDLIPVADRARLTEQIDHATSALPVHAMSAMTGLGVDAWVDLLLGQRNLPVHPVEVDYEIYGRAEACLGWLNATIQATSQREFSPLEFGQHLITQMQVACQAAHCAIAHLKLLVATSQGSNRIALTSDDGRALWAGNTHLPPEKRVSAIINARAVASPERLRHIVEDALFTSATQLRLTTQIQHLEAFAPAPPKRPVYVEQERH